MLQPNLLRWAEFIAERRICSDGLAHITVLYDTNVSMLDYYSSVMKSSQSVCNEL